MSVCDFNKSCDVYESWQFPDSCLQFRQIISVSEGRFVKCIELTVHNTDARQTLKTFRRAFTSVLFKTVKSFDGFHSVASHQGIARGPHRGPSCHPTSQHTARFARTIAASTQSFLAIALIAYTQDSWLKTRGRGSSPLNIIVNKVRKHKALKATYTAGKYTLHIYCAIVTKPTWLTHAKSTWLVQC